MTSTTRSAIRTPLARIKRETRKRLPNDVLALLRRRMGTPRPWDPGVVLDPPETPAGHRIGPPDFVGVGTQKAGTSWWYEIIASHPGVHDVVGAHKERHFFSPYWDQPFGPADVDRYHRWFPRPEGAITGEWTPQYLHQPWVPALLAQAAPGARILVLLRDPIERYRSGMTHYAARDQDLDSRLALDAIERGCYARQVDRLLRFFPREQILLLQYEAVRADPLPAARRTFEFLGLDPDHVPGDMSSEVNTTRVAKVELPEHLLTDLRRLYQADGPRLRELMPDLDLGLWPTFAP